MAGTESDVAAARRFLLLARGRNSRIGNLVRTYYNTVPQNEWEDWSMPDSCDECGTPIGKLHEIFCIRERCPFCGSQLVSCGCISRILRLNDLEQNALDEYIDDTLEPLKSINDRWIKALHEKGRVPFT